MAVITYFIKVHVHQLQSIRLVAKSRKLLAKKRQLHLPQCLAILHWNSWISEEKPKKVAVNFLVSFLSTSKQQIYQTK